jgi:hypothetical protein
MTIKTKSFLSRVATTIVASAFALAAAGAANAALIVSGSVGGAPTGVVLDNLDWLALGNAGGVSPQSGATVSFGGTGQAVTGSVVNTYAAPFLSGSNGNGFGNPIGTNQPDGVDATTYITSGSTGSVAGSFAQILLPDNAAGGYLYFGLLWGSVDDYNTLSFYNGDTLIGTVTGADVAASPNGDPGVNGTLYVNITSTERFNRVVASSTEFAFEFDNIAFNVPGPATLGLLGLGLVGLGFARRRRNV